MATEYTDLQCASAETAQVVKEYLREQLAQEEEPPRITAYVEKATLRIAYINSENYDRVAWDMQLLGFRDGYEAALGGKQ